MKFTTEYGPHGEVRFLIVDPPACGARLHTSRGEALVFEGLTSTGMLSCLQLSDGSRQIYFPIQIRGAKRSVTLPCGTSGDRPRSAARLLGKPFVKRLLGAITAIAAGNASHELAG